MLWFKGALMMPFLIGIIFYEETNFILFLSGYSLRRSRGGGLFV